MVKCSSCGLDVEDTMENCPNCGNDLKKTDVAEKTDNPSVKCSNCGADLAENTLFCSICGTKVDVVKDTVQTNTCPNCGVEVEKDITFCHECGANVLTGEKSKHELKQVNSSFTDKINLNSIVKPTIGALIVSIILSLIGLLIGFSWLSFIIAIILSAGFFGAAVENDANAIIFGLIVGLILGILENPLVEFI